MKTTLTISGDRWYHNASNNEYTFRKTLGRCYINSNNMWYAEIIVLNKVITGEGDTPRKAILNAYSI